MLLTSIQQATPLGHSNSPAVRPASSESADTEVLQTSESSAPSGRRPFTHVLLSRPIKSEPADDDIAIVGQTMARTPMNQVRFIPPQVLTLVSLPGSGRALCYSFRACNFRCFLL